MRDKVDSDDLVLDFSGLSLAEKTQKFWEVSNAYNGTGPSMTCERALVTLRQLGCELGPDHPLKQKVVGLQMLIINRDEKRKVAKK